MTYRQIYNQARRTLREAGVEAGDFETRELAGHFFGLDRQGLAVMGERECPDGPETRRFLEAVTQRAQGRPLQYILGSWDFAGMPFAVREGVLIPREDTMALCRAAQEKARGLSAPVILDLCAGSGAVGITLSREIPGSRVYCCELSPDALAVLRENCRRLSPSVTVAACDILARESLGLLPQADLIVSNPPYIPTGELDALQREVRREPRMALDGGGDGLLFYRCLTSLWKKKLKPGGLLLVEIGMGQEEDVLALFSQAGFTDCGHMEDTNGVRRVIYGTAPLLRK